MVLRTLVLGLLACFALAPRQAVAEEASIRAWHNFDAEDVALPAAEDCTVARSGDDAVGAGCLKITLPQPMSKVARVTFDVPKDHAWGGSLRAQIRCAGNDDALSLRWHAEGAYGDALFQRKFSHDGGAVWTQHDLPLALWRWGNNRAGAWREVRKLTLVIESRAREVCLDEVCWAGTAEPYANPQIHEAFAFDGQYRHMSRGGLRIATDGKITPQEFEAMFKRFVPIIAWLKRVFGEQCNPAHDGDISVLIFAEREGLARFCKRLGTAWRATITPPTAGGYTVQDIALSNLDDSGSFERPVFFHEVVHAIAARHLQLVPGHERHGWLQEGLANYLQLCLFPESLALETYPKLFKEGIGERTLFVPLKTLFSTRVEMKHYAQLAALTAWLVEKRPELLKQVQQAVATGGKIEDVLTAAKTDLDTLQTEWLSWGRATFKDDTGRKVHFVKPAEWE